MYKDGTTYDRNGNKMFDGKYKNDQRHGKWIHYYENGQINQISYYNNGKFDLAIELFNNMIFNEEFDDFLTLPAYEYI